jgi:tetratricopeptide (TPR) repeat protein
MGSAALKTSVAVGRLLRNRRKELRLTLREVSERIAEAGESFPTSTLVRVEQGKLDPGIRRLHILLRLYDIPPHLVADLVELEKLAVEEPKGKDLETLCREGVELWKKGEIGEALAYLFAIRQHVPDDDKSRLLRQRATLNFAIAASDLGKHKLARQLMDDLLCEPPDPALISRVLIFAASVWRGLGSVEMALASIRQAATHVADDDDQQRAWVLHQEARLLVETGDLKGAKRALDRVMKLYRELGDKDGEARASIVNVNLHLARGEVKAALTCARRTLRMAEEHGLDLSVLSSRLEIGRLLIMSGSSKKALEPLHKALAQATGLGERRAEFYAHYHLWKAHEALGDRDRAKFELHAASYFVQFIEDPVPEAAEVRALINSGKATLARPGGASTA